MLLESEEGTVVIPGVSWEAYVQMDGLLQDAPVRMKFYHDCLEIMSPISRRHEYIKGNIGMMLELYCRRRQIWFRYHGRTTLRKERECGGEPDESYVFHRESETAELVIETALTSGGIDKLEFYRPLEIPEVWIWQDGKLRLYCFEGGRYVETQASRLLPGLDAALMGRIADDPDTSDVLNEFEKSL
jgi:Uma2 family endonuclease